MHEYQRLLGDFQGVHDPQGCSSNVWQWIFGFLFHEDMIYSYSVMWPISGDFAAYAVTLRKILSVSFQEYVFHIRRYKFYLFTFWKKNQTTKLCRTAPIYRLALWKKWKEFIEHLLRYGSCNIVYVNSNFHSFQSMTFFESYVKLF